MKTGIRVKLIGRHLNLQDRLAACRMALLNAGRLDLWDEFYEEATNGNSFHTFKTILKWFAIA